MIALIITISGCTENGYLVCHSHVSNLGQESAEKVGNLALSVWRPSDSIIHTFVYHAGIFEPLPHVRHCVILSLGIQWRARCIQPLLPWSSPSCQENSRYVLRIKDDECMIGAVQSLMGTERRSDGALLFDQALVFLGIDQSVEWQITYFVTPIVNSQCHKGREGLWLCTNKCNFIGV